MTRIDRIDDDENRELREDIREELLEEGRQRQSLSLGIWIAIIAIIILLPVLWATSVSTRMGVMTLPVISKWVYEPVTPQREIVPLAGYQMSDVLGTFGARSKYDFGTGFVDTFIKEQELTTLISKALSETEGAPFEVSDAQIAVEEDFMELYVTMVRENGIVPLRARIMPSTDGRTLGMEVHEIVIGGYTVPESLTNLMFSAFGENILTSVQEGMAKLGALRAVNLQQGQVDITFDPSDKVQ